MELGAVVEALEVLEVVVLDAVADVLAETPAFAPTAVTPIRRTPIATTAAVPPVPRCLITLFSLFITDSPVRLETASVKQVS